MMVTMRPGYRLVEARWCGGRQESAHGARGGRPQVVSSTTLWNDGSKLLPCICGAETPRSGPQRGLWPAPRPPATGPDRGRGRRVRAAIYLNLHTCTWTCACTCAGCHQSFFKSSSCLILMCNKFRFFPRANSGRAAHTKMGSYPKLPFQGSWPLATGDSEEHSS